ncbi:MAG: VanZ family protein [Candidatus Acidiferrum sp.]
MSKQLSGQSRFHYWIPAIFVAILISVFSTRYFSDQQTGRVIIPLLHWIFPWAKARTLRLMHIGVRKMAHVTEFGAFSITVFRGVRAGRNGWRLSWAVATLVLAVAYAGFDEWHQSFVPLRHSSPRDVAIDAAGALLAQFIVWWYATRRWPFSALSGISAKMVDEGAKDY